MPAREEEPSASLIVGLSYESVVGSSLPTRYGGGEGTAAGTAGLIGSVLDDRALDALHGRITYGAVDAANVAAWTGTHSPRHPPTATTPRAEGAGAGEGPRAGTLLPLQEGVRAVEVPVHPRGRAHDLPVELGQQGDHGTVEEGVRFEPRASGGLGSGNGGVGDSSGEGLALEAAVGRRGEGLTSPRWLWPPRSDDTQGGAECAARRERRGGEGGERSNEGAQGLRSPGKEQAGSARTSRHRQGGVAGAMRVR